MTDWMIIGLRGIRKFYNGKQVLKNCSHVFDRGKLHALIGPNGSGKSTLLRICGLIEEADEGEIFYDNTRVVPGKYPELQRRVSLVLSKGGLFNTTVYGNAAFGLKIRGISLRQRKKLVEKILDKVGLWDKRKQNARTLSAGEGQRLAIARALVIDPEVILLDEPTASLDPANTTIIEAIVRDLIKDRHRTVIMATHNMFQAQRLSDKVVFMNDGNLSDEGATPEFFENPGNEIAFQFITGKLIC